MPNVLVIGNGFDLYHGLKTKYIDFINVLKKEKKNDMSNNEKNMIDLANDNIFFRYFKSCDSIGDGWIDFEIELNEIINDFMQVIDLFNKAPQNNLELVFDNGENLSVKCVSILSAMDKCFAITSANNKQTISIKYDYYGPQGIKKGRIIDDLRKNFDEFITILREYLEHECKDNNVDKISSQIAEINPSYVVNFNYTSTCNKYGITDEQIYYIHGSLDSDPNNMVLGFASNEESESNIDFVYFKKYFQRIQKRTGMLDTKQFYSNDSIGNHIAATTYFFGHSLSNNDGEIIRQIKSLSKQIIIYYITQTDFESKVVNLIDVFGKEAATEMIQKGFIKFEKII